MRESTTSGKIRLPGGGQVHYTVLGREGAAPPLLLHRPLGGSMALWGAFATRLSRAMRVIAFDPLGVGASSDAPLFHSTRRMAGDGLDLLNALGVGRAHLFGLSLGAMVASWMAIDAPQRTASLILASMPGPPGGARGRAVAGARELLRWFLRPGSGEVGLVSEGLSEQFRQAHPGRVHEIASRVSAIGSKRSNLLRRAAAAAFYSGGPGMRGLQVPTLVLGGEWDRGADDAAGHDPTWGIPGARVEQISGAGSDVTLEQPVETADRVVAFVRQVAG